MQSVLKLHGQIDKVGPKHATKTVGRLKNSCTEKHVDLKLFTIVMLLKGQVARILSAWWNSSPCVCSVRFHPSCFNIYSSCSPTAWVNFNKTPFWQNWQPLNAARFVCFWKLFASQFYLDFLKRKWKSYKKTSSSKKPDL